MVFFVKGTIPVGCYRRKDKSMQQLKQLKRKSLNIREGMPIKWPGQTKAGKYDVAKATARIDCKCSYNTKNGITAYVDRGVLFVTPFKTAVKILETCGFKEDAHLHVPFSSKDSPVGKDARKWEQLILEANLPRYGKTQES